MGRSKNLETENLSSVLVLAQLLPVELCDFG